MGPVGGRVRRAGRIDRARFRRHAGRARRRIPVCRAAVRGRRDRRDPAGPGRGANPAPARRQREDRGRVGPDRGGHRRRGQARHRPAIDLRDPRRGHPTEPLGPADGDRAASDPGPREDHREHDPQPRRHRRGLREDQPDSTSRRVPPHDQAHRHGLRVPANRAESRDRLQDRPVDPGDPDGVRARPETRRGHGGRQEGAPLPRRGQPGARGDHADPCPRGGARPEDPRAARLDQGRERHGAIAAPPRSRRVPRAASRPGPHAPRPGRGARPSTPVDDPQSPPGDRPGARSGPDTRSRPGRHRGRAEAGGRRGAGHRLGEGAAELLQEDDRERAVPRGRRGQGLQREGYPDGRGDGGPPRRAVGREDRLDPRRQLRDRPVAVPDRVAVASAGPVVVARRDRRGGGVDADGGRVSLGRLASAGAPPARGTDRGRYPIDTAPEPGHAPSERVRELVRFNPEAAAGVLQRWIGQGGHVG